MTRVFGSAADIDVKIHYRDTDSIHLNYEDVDKVVKRYKDNYGLELVGDELGKFHVYFPDIEKGCGEVYGTESLFLGKKTILMNYNLQIKKANQSMAIYLD